MAAVATAVCFYYFIVFIYFLAIPSRYPNHTCYYFYVIHLFRKKIHIYLWYHT